MVAGPKLKVPLPGVGDLNSAVIGILIPMSIVIGLRLRTGVNICEVESSSSLSVKGGGRAATSARALAIYSILVGAITMK